MIMYYFRSKGGRAVAIIMAIVMALTIYSSVGLMTAHADADDAAKVEISKTKQAPTAKKVGGGQAL